MSRSRRAIIVAEAGRLGLDPNKGSMNSAAFQAAEKRARARKADNIIDALPKVADAEELDSDLDNREDDADNEDVLIVDDPDHEAKLIVDDPDVVTETKAEVTNKKKLFKKTSKKKAYGQIDRQQK